MCVYGRIVKVTKKSTLLWHNGTYTKLEFSSKHKIGDIIDKNDVLITECGMEYDHEQDRELFGMFKKRFLYLKKIRQFFEDRGFIEAATPKLKKSIINETNISLMKTPYGYLTPSPEVEIKKLISLGFDKIFELCYAYRSDHENSLHKKEFLILEWYRALAKPQSIVQEAIELIKYLNGGGILKYDDADIDLNATDYASYKELFEIYAGIDIDDFDIQKIKKRFDIEGSTDRLEILDAVFVTVIEKKLGWSRPVVVYNFPKERAALSKIRNGYAQRFELYIAGVELSNCYDEENNYKEVSVRFNNTDRGFFEAMNKGIPSASGIALGVDRLIMLLDNRKSIQ